MTIKKTHGFWIATVKTHAGRSLTFCGRSFADAWQMASRHVWGQAPC